VKLIEQKHHVGIFPSVGTDAEATPVRRTELTPLKVPAVFAQIHIGSVEPRVTLRPVGNVTVVEQSFVADN
jgi:hypothetical protein